MSGRGVLLVVHPHATSRRDGSPSCRGCHRLHYSLHLGQTGRWLFGLAAALWVFDCFVGAALTLPRASQSSPGAPWLRRWARAFAGKTSSLRALVFTGHRALGLWLWGMLLVFALSAVLFNWRTTGDAVLEATLGLTRPPPSSSAGGPPVLTPAQALARGTALIQAAARRLFVSGFGVGVAALSVSGVWIWARRMRRRRGHGPP
ncbi:MAG: PepSY-associated TM helix domain-containing protein [Myxococcota bacterium]